MPAPADAHGAGTPASQPTPHASITPEALHRPEATMHRRSSHQLRGLAPVRESTEALEGGAGGGAGAGAGAGVGAGEGGRVRGSPRKTSGRRISGR